MLFFDVWLYMPESKEHLVGQTTSLFRQQALDAQKITGYGRIVLIRPLSFTVLTSVAVVLGLLVVALFYVGSYTRRTPVVGLLTPAQGMVRVYPMQSGVVISRLVKEGQPVVKGDVLYVISSERTAAVGVGVQAQISQQVSQRQQSLVLEIAKTRQVQLDDQRQIRGQMEGIRRELAQLDSLMAEQQRREVLSRTAVDRYAALVQKGFASQEQLQQQQEALLDQSSRYQTLSRDRINLQAELDRQQRELDALPLKQQTVLAQLDRSLNQTQQELTESEARRELRVLAPKSGTVTAVLAELGQGVDPNRSLVSIVPHDSRLEAQLYVPSRAAGFIQDGQSVLLRYQAFPYQKFGQGVGVVTSVSRTALSPNELSASGLALDPSVLARGEPVYRVTVQVQQQAIKAYGKWQPLQAGMMLDADILQEKRRLYEWVLEPLFTVSGRV
jgi:membrane fusion protein